MRQLHRPRLQARAEGSTPRAVEPLWWLAASAVLFFLVPWIGADLLQLQPDLYYLGYFTVAVAFFAAFVLRHAADLRPLWAEHLVASIIVGAAAGAALLVPIFQQPATAHPLGWRFGFEIVWRGLVYGCIDALTLFVLPAAVAYLLMGGNRRTVARRAGFAGLALLLSLVVTTTYHLGYPEYRGELMRFPEIGAVVANVPTALTGNPVGAVVAHVTMHVGAVVHQRDGGPAHMLPPKVTAGYADHGSSELAAALAAGWLAVTATALVLVVRRARGSAA